MQQFTTYQLSTNTTHLTQTFEHLRSDKRVLSNYPLKISFRPVWHTGTFSVVKFSECAFQGNAYFKEGKYEAAVECYSRGMEADSMNVLLPANRAMAFLKLEK